MPRLLLATILMLAALAAPAAAQDVEVGIADQKTAMFSDARFQSLGIAHARLSVSWDSMSSGWQREQIDGWMNAAREAGVEPLISFGHSRLPGQFRKLPSQQRFRLAFKRFRKRYPWARNYATWNEANLCGQPTCRRPEVVASYYRGMKAECPPCRILAAEVLDVSNMVEWVKAFRKAVGKGKEPRYWGLHNYVDANRFRTRTTEQLLKITKGEIWLTETGGIVRKRNNARVPLVTSVPHAARAMRWLFDRLVPLSPRIKRVYVYHWNSTAASDSWDSAFIDPKGNARPALEVLRRRLLR